MNGINRDHALSQGTMIQEYRIVKVLRTDSFGIVYIAENKYFNEIVALKEFLPKDLACRSEDARVLPLSAETEETYRWALKRFLDEARTLQELGHPIPHRNIVRVRQFIEANDTAYMVMDYEEGRPLSQILDKRGTLPEGEIKNILVPLLDGLERVHEANVWHRDVKPNNILIRPDGSPVLIDFGAARREVVGTDRSILSALTPAYAALEQVYAAGQEGPWTDIYALGATLYRAVVGKKPTNASERFLQGTVYTPAIQAAEGDYSQTFLAAIDAALELISQDRPQSIAKWRKQLMMVKRQGHLAMEYDVFICHASEDKLDVALPLVKQLQSLGLKVWIDEFELTLGDSLRRNIDHGLTKSRYGVVVLSSAFFSKEWPNKELDGLVAREDGTDKVILPIWHNVGAEEIVKYSPILADKMAVSTSKGLDYVAERIFEAIKRSNGEAISASKIVRWPLPSEHEILQRLGHQTLTAKSSRELRYTLYELEEYLAKYPHSPKARMLKDRIEAGLLRSEEMEMPATMREAPMARGRIGMSLFLKIVIWLLIVLGITASLILFFK